MTLLRGTVLLACAIVLLPWLLAPAYQYPDPTPFHGPHWVNPYEGGNGPWRRAVLHAHSRAWGGLTDGRQSSDEMRRRYHDMGYEVVAISNYAQIDPTSDVPVYEHGYNLRKTHQLAIGARRVDWLDPLVSLSLDQEQRVIDRVADTAELVALNHPNLRGGYAHNDLRRLTGYQLMEVVNGPLTALDAWDAALSSGHPVWALANDDAHDLDMARRCNVAWTLVQSAGTSAPEIIEALRAGRTVAVSRTGLGDETTLTRVTCRDDRLTVTCGGPPARFEFIGQEGQIRSVVEGVTTASCPLGMSDSYLRTVIRTPATTLYLNPVVRSETAGPPAAPRATVESDRAWLARLVFITLSLLALMRLLWAMRHGPPGSPARRFSRLLKLGRRFIVGRLIVITVTPLMHLLGATLRIEQEGNVWHPDTDAPPFWVYWHEASMVAVWQYRHKGFHAMISTSWLGDVTSMVVSRLGTRPIRGSSADKGASAFREMLAVLRAGGRCAIMTDGPRGPRRVSKPGAALLSRLSERAIVPVGVAAASCWRLRGWDRFIIPKPFSRVIIVMGDAIAPPDPDVAEASMRETLQREQDRVTAMAEARVSTP